MSDGRAAWHPPSDGSRVEPADSPSFRRLTMSVPSVDFDPEQVAEFCRRHQITRLSLFGSVLRDDFTPESDVDVLVEFAPGRTPGVEFFALGDELGGIIGR